MTTKKEKAAPLNGAIGDASGKITNRPDAGGTVQEEPKPDDLPLTPRSLPSWSSRRQTKRRWPWVRSRPKAAPRARRRSTANVLG